MRKIMKKLVSKNLVSALALTLITVTEVMPAACSVWIFGADEIPDELLED